MGVAPRKVRHLATHYAPQGGAKQKEKTMRKIPFVTFEEMEKEDAERITASLKTLWDFIGKGDTYKVDAIVALRDIEELISSRVLNNY